MWAFHIKCSFVRVVLQEINSYLKGLNMWVCVVKTVSSVFTRVARIKATGEH